MKTIEYIEKALQDILEARTYVTTNSISIARRTDREDSKGDQFVELMAESEERLSNNHDLYMMDVSIQVATKIQEDLTGADIDALEADIRDAIQNDLTTATLQAAIDAIDVSSGITVAGIDYPPGTVETLEHYEYREQRLKIAFIFTP